MSMVPHNVNEPSLAMTTGSNATFSMALEPTSIDGALRLAAMIAKTGVCGVSKPEDILIRLMTGRELNLTTMQSIRQIHIIEGKPALDASLKRSLVLRSPVCEYLRVVESTNERCTYVVKRKGNPERSLTYMIEDAKIAGLDSKSTWKKYPKQMLQARASSAIIDSEFPDVCNGMMSREEAYDIATDNPNYTAPTDPREMVAEIVPNAPVRDYNAEARELTARMETAFANRDREGVAAIRKTLATCDLPPEFVDFLKAKYGELTKAAAASKAAETTEGG